MKITDFESNKSIFTTSYAINDKKDIVYVSIDEDLDLQMFTDEGADMENAMVVSLKDMLEIDNSISILPEFEKGDAFQRTDKKAAWVKVTE